MTIRSITQNHAIKKALVYTSGSASRNGLAIDMAGFDTCCFVVQFATIAASAVTTIKAQQDTTSAMSTAQDIAGSAISVADDDDDELRFLEIHNPGKRFLRVVITKNGVNASAESAVAYLFNGRKKRPITQTLAEAEGKRLVAPAEGTP